MHFSQPSRGKRHVLALVLFGTAFGYLEVVSYLRYLHEPTDAGSTRPIRSATYFRF